MIIKRLYLRNFRNYQEAEVEFSPRLNVFYGPNAQGKTNLLEAIYFLAFGRSFRTSKTSELILEGSTAFYLEADFIKHDVEQSLKVMFSPAKKSIIYNSTEYSSFIQLVGLIQGVLLAPKDHELIQGAPQLRREFLDLQIAQVDPLYIHHLVRYLRAMKHRNVLLRSKQVLGIESWEHQMAHSASYIQEKRKRVLQDLKEKTSIVYSCLSSSDDALILDDAEFLKEKYYIEELRKQRPRELFLGYTLVSPHRDDFLVRIQSREAKSFASEGQKRSAAAALRIAEWQRLLALSQEAPLFSIDDFGISLDRSRREKLQSFLTLPTQMFLTTAEDVGKESYPADTKFFRIDGGSASMIW